MPFDAAVLAFIAFTLSPSPPYADVFTAHGRHEPPVICFDIFFHCRLHFQRQIVTLDTPCRRHYDAAYTAIFAGFFFSICATRFTTRHAVVYVAPRHATPRLMSLIRRRHCDRIQSPTPRFRFISSAACLRCLFAATFYSSRQSCFLDFTRFAAAAFDAAAPALCFVTERR